MKTYQKGRRLKQFKMICSFLAAAVTIALTAPGLRTADATGAASKAGAPENVTLQLRWFHQFQFAGYYAALEKGYYREAGLEVDILEGGYEIDTVETVVGGPARYGVTNSEILLHRLKGKPVVVIAAVFQHSPLVIVSRQIDKIKHPQDLIGRRVKMTRSSRDVELHAALLNEGVSLDQLKLVDAGVFQEDYFGGSLDALSAYITNEPFFYRQKNIPYAVIQPSTYGIDFYGDCLFTSEKEAADHPERVDAFRGASLKGWDYALKHPEEIIQLILRRFESRKTEAHLRYEAEMTQQLVLPQFVEIGHMNPGRWRHIADTFVRLGMARPGYNLDNFIYHPEAPYRPIPAWIKWGGVAIIIVSVLLSALVAMFFIFNNRLKHEIAEKKESERSLRESELRYRQIVELSPDLIIIHREGKIIFMNRSGLEMLGFSSPDEVIGKRVTQFVKPSQRRLAKERMKKYLPEIGKPTPVMEQSILRRDNTEIDVEVTGITFLHEEKIHAQVIGRDITERKRHEKAIRESEEKFRIFFELCPQPACIFHFEKGVLIDVNDKFCELFAYTKDELIGKSINELNFYSMEDKRKLIRAFEVEGEIHGYEMSFSIGTGNTVTALLFSRTIRLKDDRFILTILHDITEQKRLEDQLRQSRKMEAIGTLTGGIAHDFNNIIGIILGNTELAQDMIPEDHPGGRNLNKVVSACMRARDLVKQLLDFSRKSEPVRKPINITPVVKEIMKLLRSSLPANIEIRHFIPARCDTIIADPTQLHQVFLNLSANAAQAMEHQGGLIEVLIENVTVDDSMAAEYLELDPGGYVKIVFRDTGGGIDTRIQDKIFDPYFTTKEIGKGTGMGLSVVHGIIKSHGGSIYVNSQKEKGAEFTIFFPVVEITPEIRESAEKETPTGNERVLIVDDEEAIVHIIRQILERLGYRTEIKIDPLEALELIRCDPQRFDAVITDMTMPRLNGDALVREILKIRPDMPIILCTGFNESISEEKAGLIGVGLYMEKPVDKQRMAAGLRRVLDANAFKGNNEHDRKRSPRIMK